MNRIINNTVNWIKTHPLYAMLVAIAVVLILFWATAGIGNTIESIKGRIFDRNQAAHEQEVAGLKAQRDAAVQRANEAEAKALLKETEAKELKDLIDQKGGTIEKAADKLQKDIENAKANAGSCVDSPDPRGCTCEKLRSAGFDCQ